MLAAAVHKPRWYGWVHVAFYQATWFAALWGGSEGFIWPGLLAGLLTLVIHINFTEQIKRTLKRLLLATVIGVVIDSLFLFSGVITFTPVAYWPAFLPPLWMIILWPTFASLFDDIMLWLLAHRWLAIAAGAIAGPLAYLGGQAMGALQLPQEWWLSLMVIGGAWALAMGLLIAVWRHGQVRT